MILVILVILDCVIMRHPARRKWSERGERERERERERASKCVREKRERERECARESECVRERERERETVRERYYTHMWKGYSEPVLPGSGFFPSQLGYFENTVAGKMTEPWVAVFWATYIMYRGRPKCMWSQNEVITNTRWWFKGALCNI